MPMTKYRVTLQKKRMIAVDHPQSMYLYCLKISIQ